MMKEILSVIFSDDNSSYQLSVKITASSMLLTEVRGFTFRFAGIGRYFLPENGTF